MEYTVTYVHAERPHEVKSFTLAIPKDIGDALTMAHDIIRDETHSEPYEILSVARAPESQP